MHTLTSPSTSSRAGEVDPAVLADLGGDHLAVARDFKRYARAVREAAQGRRFRRIDERLESADREHRLGLLDELRSVLDERSPQDWRGLFHTWDEFSEEAVGFAIRLLQEAGVTLIGGLAGHGKTLIMLSMVKSLLEETPLFGYKPFSVSRPALRVCYLIPESSIGPFWARVKLFRLEQYVKEDRLLIRTLSSPEQVELTDPRILKVAEGAEHIPRKRRALSRPETETMPRISGDFRRDVPFASGRREDDHRLPPFPEVFRGGAGYVAGEHPARLWRFGSHDLDMLGAFGT